MPPPAVRLVGGLGVCEKVGLVALITPSPSGAAVRRVRRLKNELQSRLFECAGLPGRWHEGVGTESAPRLDDELRLASCRRTLSSGRPAKVDTVRSREGSYPPAALLSSKDGPGRGSRPSQSAQSVGMHMPRGPTRRRAAPPAGLARAGRSSRDGHPAARVAFAALAAAGRPELGLTGPAGQKRPDGLSPEARRPNEV